ncbi:MAG: adenylate/guanylate cyclase domain-containing protein [Actinomycetota bacterium]
MALPTGTVTFWMSDIEGSTRLLADLGDRYADVLAAHHDLVRGAVAAHEGVEVSTEGDSFFCVFCRPGDAVAAAVDVQRALAAQSWPHGDRLRVRVGVHVGAGVVASTGYVGLDVHRTARVSAAGHGGQVLLTAPTRALVEGQLPEGVSTLFLGPHRLKDLDAPELLYQLVVDGLEARFPPLRSLEAPAYDLPTARSAFVGRSRELADLQRLVGEHHLVTLTGPGGVGKTRLALRLAAHVSGSYPGGVVFVPLAGVRDAALVPDEVARALALPVGRYTGPDGVRRLGDQLAGRRLLLVLDNLEQLLAGASHVGALLDAAPGATVVATSRAPLRLRDEQEYPVEPLAVPRTTRLSVDELLEHDAARQFLDRARAVRPGLELSACDVEPVVRILSAVDGLPLAVELAAARVRSLSLPEIADRLGRRLAFLRGGPRDLPQRQQTIRDTLRWSYDLLDPPARYLLEVLAVFPGGVTLGALDAVATVRLPADDVLEAVEQLVDQSMLHRSVDRSDRYRTLSVVRELAAELLEASGQAEPVRRRHAEWLTGLVERTAPLLTADLQAEGLEALRAEHDNLREGLQWAVTADPGMAARMACGLWRYWQMRGHLAEGRAVLEQLLTQLPERTAARGRVLSALGGIAYWQHDRSATRAAYAEAVDVYTELDDAHSLAGALYDLVFPVGQAGDVDEADQLAQRSGALYAELGDEDGVARSVWARGTIAVNAGRDEDAETLLTEAVRRFRQLNDVYYLGWGLRMLGLTRLRQGRAAAAREVLDESMRMFAPAGDTSAVVLHLADFASLAALEGDVPRALRLAGAQRALQRATGTHLADWTINRVPALADLLARTGPAEEALLAEGAGMDLDAAVRYALDG